MPLRRARRLLPVLLAALVLALAACTGGADDPPSPPATTPIAATATPVAATATMAPTPTATSTPTPSLTPTPTATPVPTETPAPSPTATATPSPTPTATPSPAPTAQPTAFRYGSYDTSGEVAEPGSYAFLAHPADTASAITTYEGLRDGSATALRIHETDAGGVSRAAFLDTVEVGDLFEWRQAEDCWVRYRVIGVEAGSDTRDFAIKSYSHTYTGCSGAIGGSAAREFTWAPEALKTGDFPVPTWHGPWLLIRAGWTGPAPDPSDPSSYAAITPPAITWPPDPLPDPDLGPGWRGGVARATASSKVTTPTATGGA